MAVVHKAALIQTSVFFSGFSGLGSRLTRDRSRFPVLKAAGAPLVVPLIPLSPPPFVVCQQVRETETWMPMKTEQTAATSPHRDALESSGSDFGFADDEDEDDSVGLKWVSCPREPSSRFLFCQQKHV